MIYLYEIQYFNPMCRLCDNRRIFVFYTGGYVYFGFYAFQSVFFATLCSYFFIPGFSAGNQITIILPDKFILCIHIKVIYHLSFIFSK